MGFNSRALTLGVRKEPFLVLIAVLLIPIGFFELAVGYDLSEPSGPQFSSAQERLLRCRSSQLIQFAQEQADYIEWLGRRGTAAEHSTMLQVSSYLSERLLPLASEGRELSPLSSLRVTFSSGLQRLSFLFLASLRLAVFAMLLALIEGSKSAKAYVARDILGLTGNNRLFYSGAKLRLLNKSKKGSKIAATSVHIPTVTGLKTAEPSVVKSSSLYRLLNEHGALNSTNEYLLSILLYYSSCIPFVAPEEEKRLLDESFNENSTLSDYTYRILTELLGLHTRYATKQFGGVLDYVADQAGPFSTKEYAKFLVFTCNRILSPESRNALGSISLAQFAAFILSTSAAKILSYTKEDDGWSVSSTALQSYARTAFNSSASIAEDFDNASIRTTRRALLYSGLLDLTTVLPADFNGTEWALRQIGELLFTNPHQLEFSADRLELFGLLREGARGWQREFIDSALLLSAESGRSVFATKTEDLLIPLGQILANMRRALSRAQVDRLRELRLACSDRERLHRFDLHAATASSGLPELLSEDKVEQLARDHGLSENDVRDWSVVRSILTYVDWLPSQSRFLGSACGGLVFAILSADVGDKISRIGMVLIKGSALQNRWGPQWISRLGTLFKCSVFSDIDSYKGALKSADRVKVLPVDRVPISRGSRE